MTYEYNKVMNEKFPRRELDDEEKKVEEEEERGNCLVNTLFFAYGVYYDNMLDVYFNMGLRLEDLHV